MNIVKAVGGVTFTLAVIEAVGEPPEPVKVTVQLYKPGEVSAALFNEARTVAGVGPVGDARVSQLQLTVGAMGVLLAVKLIPPAGFALVTAICCAGGTPWPMT